MIKKYIIFTIIAIIVLLIIWIVYGNRALEIKTINVSSEAIPTGFNGFKIAHISDLHNEEFGKDNIKLLSLLKETEADIIVITGDIIDSRRTNIDIAVHFVESAVKIAPTYYANGNHESRLSDDEYNLLITKLSDVGATVLENDTKDISLGDETITLVGINDPDFSMKLSDDNAKQNIKRNLMSIIGKNDNYKVLLAHRPEYFDVYTGKVDLVLSGHAHGGQINIPFLGGVIAPGQGFFPEYYDGLYENGTTKMIVSRGLGNSLFPFRVNNKPVIVVAELTSLSIE